MNGESIDPWLHKELPNWAIAYRYMFNFDRALGLWLKMYLRRTELSTRSYERTANTNVVRSTVV